ncbi:MAG: hypothetical protein ACKV2V_26240 [Blastocatellia bacterium]
MTQALLFRLASLCATLLLLSVITFADTLYLRNGSVLQGTFMGYENSFFLFIVHTGEDSASIKPTRFAAAEVTRLVISRPGAKPPDSGTGPRPATGAGRFDAAPPIEVRLLDQWVKSDVQVTRGQRVRIEGSGQVVLEGTTTSAPEGLSRRDASAPLPNENDGALIAAIGTDVNSPPILVGRLREFTADRDGVLYFTVNHWNTANARGFYLARIFTERAQTSGGAPAGGQGTDWRERTLTLNANRQWMDTGFDVEPRMLIEISASGTISLDSIRRVEADGDNSQKSSVYAPMPGAPMGALIAKIRYRDGTDSSPVAVGSQRSLSVEQNESGRLWLGINDENVGDNKGSFVVRVRVRKQ